MRQHSKTTHRHSQNNSTPNHCRLRQTPDQQRQDEATATHHRPDKTRAAWQSRHDMHSKTHTRAAWFRTHVLHEDPQQPNTSTESTTEPHSNRDPAQRTITEFFHMPSQDPPDQRDREQHNTAAARHHTTSRDMHDIQMQSNSRLRIGTWNTPQASWRRARSTAPSRS